MNETILDCDKQGSILTEALTLLKNDERSINRISLETRIPPGWLHNLSNGKMTQPSVNRIEYLIIALRQKQA